MRHYKKSGMKLGTDSSHTKAMKKSLACALLSNDRIKTTEQRAKAIRPDVERVVTWAKKGDLHSRRLAIAKLGNPELVREVFDKAAQGMWADRNGGYTRIMKLGQRKGDSAEVVIIEMVNESLKPKKAAKTEVKPVKKAAAKKPADKKAEKAADEAEVDKKAAEATEEPAEKPAE
ncbi:MAG: 50S ribosomal protein L17 [Atopobiaceae bacterium]|jgi:large subunit ribosomal protein L17